MIVNFSFNSFNISNNSSSSTSISNDTSSNVIERCIPIPFSCLSLMRSLSWFSNSFIKTKLFVRSMITGATNLSITFSLVMFPFIFISLSSHNLNNSSNDNLSYSFLFSTVSPLTESPLPNCSKYTISEVVPLPMITPSTFGA